jgi:uncharacterized membrane protein
MDATETLSPAIDFVTVWQCIGCGRIEAPQPCIGVCQDRQVRFVAAADHEEALGRLQAAQHKAKVLEGLMHRLTLTSPREGEWKNCYTTFQAEARRLLSELASEREAARGVQRDFDRPSHDGATRGSKGRGIGRAAVIDDIEIARALHVVFVAHWIGGVAFVTLVALPLARTRGDAAEGWALFEAIESRFAAQVRWSIPLAGATGLWMTFRLGLWAAFGDPSFWWMDAMALLWALFMAIVFVVEPLAHDRIAAMAAKDPAALLMRLSRVHFVLLAAGMVTIFGAVAGAHGGVFG